MNHAKPASDATFLCRGRMTGAYPAASPPPRCPEPGLPARFPTD